MLILFLWLSSSIHISHQLQKSLLQQSPLLFEEFIQFWHVWCADRSEWWCFHLSKSYLKHWIFQVDSPPILSPQHSRNTRAYILRQKSKQNHLNKRSVELLFIPTHFPLTIVFRIFEGFPATLHDTLNVTFCLSFPASVFLRFLSGSESQLPSGERIK